MNAVYVEAPEGGYSAWVLGAVGAATQGETIEEARQNVLDVIRILLEDAPGQLVHHAEKAPPGALMERIVAIVP